MITIIYAASRMWNLCVQIAG